MEMLKPPEGLSFSGNVADNWKRFLQRVELFLEATGSDPDVRTDRQKIAILLHVAGPEAVDVFNTFTLTEDERESFEAVVHKFQDYCAPKANETFERHVFRKTIQMEGQSFENFLRDVKLKVRSCNFGDLTDSLVRDQIVDGVRDHKLRERLLREDDLTLEKATRICKAAENSSQQARMWMDQHPTPVEQVDAMQKSEKSASRLRCRKCNRFHAPRRCPAFGKICNLCGKKHHFAICCDAKPQDEQSRRRVEEVEIPSEDNFEILQVGESGKIAEKDWLIKVMIEKLPVQFKVDTGSQVNLLPLSLFRSANSRQHLIPSQAVLQSYNGSAIGHLGKARTGVHF